MASLSFSLSTQTTPTSFSFISSSIFFSSHQFHTHNNSPWHNKKMFSSAAALTSKTSTVSPPPPSLATRSEAAAGSPSCKKKTGRARPGGGVIFGPKPRDWSIKINCKEKRLTISTVVVNAAASAVVVEDFAAEFADKSKTKEFITAMKLL